MRTASQYQHRLVVCFRYSSVHGVPPQQGLLTAGAKGIKAQVEILKLLEVLWEPTEVAVVRKGHQKGGDPVAKGNRVMLMQPPRRLPGGSHQTNSPATPGDTSCPESSPRRKNG